MSTRGKCALHCVTPNFCIRFDQQRSKKLPYQQQVREMSQRKFAVLTKTEVLPVGPILSAVQPVISGFVMGCKRQTTRRT